MHQPSGVGQIFAKETSTDLEKVVIDERASGTGLEVLFKCDCGLFFCKSEVRDEEAGVKLRGMWGTTFVVCFKPLA